MVQAVVDRDVVTLVRVAPLPAVPDDLLKDAVPGVVEAAPVLEVAPNATGEHCSRASFSVVIRIPSFVSEARCRPAF